MKLKKILFYICVVLSIFIIYNVTYKDTINYVALGDSIALGINSYGEEGYGYPDYVKDYLKNLKKLGCYTKGFSKREQKIEDLYDDINNNKTIVENGNYYNIKSALRESDLVSITIGLSDFKNGFTLEGIINNLDNIVASKKRIDEISIEFEELLELIKKYAKGDIIVIGYYNPFPYLDSHKQEINEIVEYGNKKIQQICEKNSVYFVDVFDYFVDRTDYLPNPFDVHPTVLGYNEIFKQVKKVLDQKILNGVEQ